MIHIYHRTQDQKHPQHQQQNEQQQTHAETQLNSAPAAIFTHALEGQSWQKSLAATAEHIQKLVTDLGIPADFLTDALDLDERPRIEQQGACTLLMIHVPYNKAEVVHHYDEVKYRTIPFAIILTPQHIVTVCTQDQLFHPEMLSQSSNGQNAALFNLSAPLLILQKTAEHYQKLVQELEAAIVAAEDELSRSYRNQELYALLYLNESLLYVTTSLKQLLQVIGSDDFKDLLVINAEEQERYAQTVIELEQVYAVAEINQLNLNNVMDAYGNIIQNNVSHVVKLLTAVTIVLSIPTLIASVYGMNVPLPYQEADHAFSVIIIAMLLSSGVVAYYFHKKRYF